MKKTYQKPRCEERTVEMCSMLAQSIKTNNNAAGYRVGGDTNINNSCDLW